VEVVGVPAWAVTTEAELMAVIADNRFAKSPAHWAWRESLPQEWPLISWVEVENMLTADGDDHTRLRRLVSQAFTARRIARLEHQITGIARACLDDLAPATADDQGTQVVDVRERFALRFPLAVICALFGVPDTLQPHLERECAVVFDQTITGDRAADAHHRLHSLLEQLIGHKRDEPGDDLTSALIAARDEEDRLSETELVWTLVLLIGAGFETTVNLITTAIHALLTHPGERALVEAGSVPWPAVVTETLRWRPPIAMMPFRYARTTVTLAGQQINAGDAVLMCYGAAALDSSAHGLDAGEFDLQRFRRMHLAFGHGAHYCLGANLAQLEASIALRMLFETYPRIDLPVPWPKLRPLPSLIADGYAELPVRLGPLAPGRAPAAR
jgi:cytochrome P450